jgi:hypothetical protein
LFWMWIPAKDITVLPSLLEEIIWESLFSISLNQVSSYSSYHDIPHFMTTTGLGKVEWGPTSQVKNYLRWAQMEHIDLKMWCLKEALSLEISHLRFSEFQSQITMREC